MEEESEFTFKLTILYTGGSGVGGVVGVEVVQLGLEARCGERGRK